MRKKQPRASASKGWVLYHCAGCRERSTATRPRHLEHLGWVWRDEKPFCRACAPNAKGKRTVPVD